MISKYVIGNPLIQTFSTVRQIEQSADPLPYFTQRRTKKHLYFHYPLDKNDIVYGLGENMGGINKRGHTYASYNTDNPIHRENTPSLYSAHNFLIVDGKDHFGVFFDTPSKITFDVDHTTPGELFIRTANDNLDIYVITGSDSNAIAREFLSLIGRPFLPPLWAFGFGQSRWGYKSETDLLTVMEGYKLNKLPLDWLCMDIDYMDNFKLFTFNRLRFPFLPAFVEKCRKRGIHLVPIIDAGVKVEKNYDVYEEGVAGDYFCRNKDGGLFRGTVWPGVVHFPDFFRPEVRQWFGDKYKALLDLGFDGFWNDMNEPSIFSSEYSKVKSKMDIVKGFFNPHHKESKAEEVAHFDYHNFYNVADGRPLVHHLVHNLYGGYMTMASSQGIERHYDKRFLLFSRSSCIGAHRYGGLWTGDNESRWDHLRAEFHQLPGLNMCGFLYSGADTGGFGGNCTRELLLRWLALSVFTPLMRNHAARRTRSQECYMFGHISAFRNVLALRYRLLPYIYSEFMKAALNNDMYIKPLSFVFDDEKARNIEDQLMVGESIMIAPIMEKGVNQRKVYLPEPMTRVTFRDQNFITETMKKGQQTITVKEDEVVFFIRHNHCIIIGKPAMNTAEADLKEVELLGDGNEYRQYLDDGFSRDVGFDNIRLLKK
ncbi:MAG: alpha-glucosidase [Erysipelotrichaceae bacterium]|nr:alpha-glucosidase [Erysipelotrichaceae bacterium]